MRTAKCLTILLIAALAGIAAVTVAFAQDNTAQQPSNITADCLVKITVDPSVLPLNMETLKSLLHSSAVRGKAMTEVLGPGAAADRHEIIFIEWLSEAAYSAGAQRPEPAPGTEEYNDREMMKQFEAIYGRDYATMMRRAPRSSGKGSNSPGDSPTDGQDAPKEQNKQGGPRSDMETPYGGIGSVYGSAGMSPRGGMGGGVGIGGSGGAMGGMGGFGGGMMGSMDGLYVAPPGSEIGQAVEQRVIIKLEVALPDELKPFAKELLDALVVNLRESLDKAYRQHADRLENLLTFATLQRDKAQVQFEGADTAWSPDEARIKKKLDQIVDLTTLTARTPLNEAIEILKNSAQPPLPLVAQWNGLRDVDVEPTQPAGIDGLPSIRLATALDLLVKGLNRTTYRIQGDVIVVGPDFMLHKPSESGARPKGQTDVQALAAQRSYLARSIQSLDLELAGMEARRNAIQEQIAATKLQADRQLAEDSVTRELEKLIQISAETLETLRKQANAGRVSATELAQAEESLTRARIELAKRREELGKQTGGGQLGQYNNELSRTAIDKAEKTVQLDILRKQLEEAQRQLAQASTFDPEAARVRIAQETLDVANRRAGELETRLATLQPPTVMAIGAN